MINIIKVIVVMQINSIYLYPNMVTVYPNVVSSWTEERSRMVYARNVKIYRGVDNRIDFQVRNGDQKPINTTGTVLVFRLIVRENKDLVLQKDCSYDDATVGRAFVTITASELIDLEPGLYDYSITKETRTNDAAGGYTVTASSTTYLDSEYDSLGTIEVFGDVQGEAYDTVEVTSFNKVINFNSGTDTNTEPPFDTPRPNYARHTPTTGYEEFYVSSLFDGRPNLTTPNSLHTFQIYLNSYAGELVLQGSLDKGAAPIEENWTDLQSWTLSTSDSDFFYNQIGKFNWFRFKHTPDTDNTGTVDKVLYR